ncbi:DUF6580 family putative transport protein [Pedobacter sp. MW01-1-1]|uniref:DUF6580 family putative transport protein n=1 Tax=Pedobacter sp. MW01-1-1 TaxID=3383027 RepID=UPI003FEE6E4A
MSKVRINPRNIVLLSMILAVTILRLVVTFNSEALEFANFSSLGAVALFGGAYFKDYRKALLFPLMSLFISDLVLYTTIYKQYADILLVQETWTYLAIALMVVVGRVLMKKVNVFSFLASSFVIVLIHWIVSDIGSWYHNPLYTQDLAGYWRCLVNAIPFEIRFLDGTLLYGTLLFGAFEILKSKYPELKLQLQEA